MIKVTHTSRAGGAAGIIKRLENVASRRVCVGITKDTDREDVQNEKQIGNAEKLFLNTNGVRKRTVREEMQPEINKGTPYSLAKQMYLRSHGYIEPDRGNFYHTPPRPVIEPAIEENKKDISGLLKGAADTALQGGDFNRDLQNVGQAARDMAKDYFEEDNGWPPNAPATIKKKKSDKPLIDAGAMRQAITYVVREDGE